MRLYATLIAAPPGLAYSLEVDRIDALETRTEATMMNERKLGSQTQRRGRWLLAGLFAATLAIGAAQHANTAGLSKVFRPTGGAVATPVAGGDGTVRVSGTLDRTSVLQGRDGLVRMELVIEGRAPNGDLPPSNPTDLVVVLDRSGSMSGRKIADARAAIHELIAQLGPQDRFALVPFSSGAGVAIPLGHATPEATERWARIVNSIEAGGGTQMSTGLRLGLDLIEPARAASRTPRAIVISDGLAVEPHALLRADAARAARSEVPLSAVGVGADFDEDLMSMLADVGTGNYFFLEDAGRLAGVFAAEFATARETVASGLSVTLQPGSGVEVLDAAGYPLARDGASATFHPGTLFASQQRRIWVSFRVPTDRPIEHALGEIRVAYTEAGLRRELRLDDLPKVGCVVDERDFYAGLDDDAWTRALTVEGYNQLRQSVAGHVAAGRSSEAKREIADFQARYRAFDAVLAPPAASAAVDFAETLEEEVDAAFSGGDQAEKQKLLGKSLHSKGVAERRAGSRK
jgi:Ca-activated chloride channel family protein